MKFDFDQIIDRSETNSTKWNKIDKSSFPYTIADMDFFNVPDIKDEFLKRIEHNLYGYTLMNDEYYQSFISFKNRRQDIKIKREEIIESLNIMFSISILLSELTREGDSIIVFPPVYHNFYAVSRENNRNVVSSPLIYKNGEYNLDLEDFEKKIRQNSSIKVCLICSPQNPFGRIWTREELEAIYNICHKYNIILVSDEIYSDIIHSNESFTSLHSLGKKDTITLYSPAKTFNIANLPSGFVISRTPMHLKIMEKFYAKTRIYQALSCAFSTIAATICYKKGDDWLNEINKIIETNKIIVKEILNDTDLFITKSQSTFMMWIYAGETYKRLNLNPNSFSEKLKSQKVFLNINMEYGADSKDFFRVNVACHEKVLREGFNILKKIIL